VRRLFFPFALLCCSSIEPSSGFFCSTHTVRKVLFLPFTCHWRTLEPSLHTLTYTLKKGLSFLPLPVPVAGASCGQAKASRALRRY
jgi:hypothetical protein